MKNKKLILAIIAVAIIVSVSVVGVTFAVWDITSQSKNFDIKIGNHLDFKISNKVDDGNLKNFAPIANGDLTLAVKSAKLAKFDVVSKTTGADSDTILSYTNVSATYTVKADEEDLSSYVSLYILTADDYTAFTDGNDLPQGAVELTSDTLIEHSVAGHTQGVVIVWKNEILNNNFEANQDMLTKIANKTIKVELTFNVAIISA